MDLSFSIAARTFSKGLRTSSPATTALGAALVALVLLRRRQENGGTLVFRSTLRPGQSIEVAVREPTPRRSRGLSPDT